MLVILSILPVLVGWMGWFYLVCAMLLGGVLLAVGWRLLRQGGNKNAWTLYRVSSLYLAFMMLAMMLDVFIRS